MNTIQRLLTISALTMGVVLPMTGHAQASANPGQASAPASDSMTEGEVKRKLLELKEKMDNNAGTFEDLARLHSQDGSAGKGGDLGWLYPGDVMPEFEAAMAAMKPGELSGVVQTPFGFHLIQVLERKSEDVTLQKERNRARAIIRERKLGEAFEDWARQVRDRAYVEYREEQ